MATPWARWLRRGVAAAVALSVLGLAAWGARAWHGSRLPSTYNVMELGVPDYGGAAVVPVAHGAGHSRAGEKQMVSVADLTEPRGEPDFRTTLTARRTRVRLPSGKAIEVWAFNGRIPGPELRVRQGDLVEITLVNADIAQGVSIHWHGVDVPNAEDGVAGVTQDAVLPGQRRVYRFRVHQAGTFWYHSHQASSTQVKRGLYGAFVSLPRGLEPGTLDLAIVAHSFSGARTLGAHDGVDRRAVGPGTPVRLRVINSDSFSRRFVLAGTPFRVVAIDGTELHEPTALRGQTLELAGGGRYDLAFTMPRRTVQLHLLGAKASLALSQDGRGALPAGEPGPEFDPLRYGSPAPTPVDASSHFDRTFMLHIGKRFGFLDGRFGRHWSVNGKLLPNLPTQIVSRGDLVKMTFVNDTDEDHPMHLHGHHMLVLSRDGAPATGSSWWSDTLNVKPGERYEVAFRADNPGLWMNHCHNLERAADGLVLHLAYDNVMTPFRVGAAAHNHPE